MMKKKINPEELEYKNLLQRTLADFENYKKRIESEKALWTNSAKAEIVENLLPVMDNLVLMVNHKPAELQDNSWAQGVELVAKQIEESLLDEGIEKITPEVNEKFDPNLHEAISATEDKKVQSGHIVKMQKPGYKIGDKIIRVAQVITAK
jgi:molecular chaperone GrpE